MMDPDGDTGGEDRAEQHGAPGGARCRAASGFVWCRHALTTTSSLSSQTAQPLPIGLEMARLRDMLIPVQYNKIRYYTMNTATLHVEVTPETADGLRRLAKARGESVGELVRQAVGSCYQVELMDLPQNQRLALDAFRGGYISQGKLAERMGMHVLDLRQWLNERGISQNPNLSEDDVRDA